MFLLYQNLASTIHEQIKKPYKSKKFKISAATKNEKFESPDGSCSPSDVNYYFNYIIKKH